MTAGRSDAGSVQAPARAAAVAADLQLRRRLRSDLRRAHQLPRSRRPRQPAVGAALVGWRAARGRRDRADVRLGPLSIARGVAFFVNRRVNPYFDQSDVRLGVRLEAERASMPWLRAGADGRLERWTSAGLAPRVTSAVGAHVTVDTRVDRVVSAQRRLRAGRMGTSDVRLRPAPDARCSTRAASWALAVRRCWRCARRRRARCPAARGGAAAARRQQHAARLPRRVIAPATAWPRCRPSCACRSTRR